VGPLGSPKGHLGPGGPMGPPERPHGPGTPWGSARPQATPTPKVIQWSAYFFTFFTLRAPPTKPHDKTTLLGASQTKTTRGAAYFFIFVLYFFHMIFTLSSTQICNPGPQLPGILSHYFHICFILFTYFSYDFHTLGATQWPAYLFHIFFILFSQFCHI